MCRSVPQMPTAPTATITSPCSGASGGGTSRNSSPNTGATFCSACIAPAVYRIGVGDRDGTGDALEPRADILQAREIVDQRRYLVQSFQVVVHVSEHRIDRAGTEIWRLREVDQDEDQRGNGAEFGQRPRPRLGVGKHDAPASQQEEMATDAKGPSRYDVVDLALDLVVDALIQAQRLAPVPAV